MSALFLGMVLALEYDCIRIFRRVIRHKKYMGDVGRRYFVLDICGSYRILHDL